MSLQPGLIRLSFLRMSTPLPNYLRTFRRQAHLSQEELARLLGAMAGSSVLRHEDYQRMPILRTALRYAAVFRTDPREIFAGQYAKERRVVLKQAKLLLDELEVTPGNAQKIAFLQVLVEDNELRYEPCEEE